MDRLSGDRTCAGAKPTTWVFRLLGPLEVVRDSVSVPLGPGKQRTLLAGLLLDPGRPVSTDRLATLLWDEEPPVSAMANIRNYAARLRAVLTDSRSSCGSRLVRRRPGYLVDADPAELDVRQFASLAAAGRRALGDGRYDLATGHLARAMALWHGTTAAEDVVRGDALAACLAAVDELRLTTLEDYAEARLAQGRHAVSVPELRAAVADHPFRERLWGQLILALYRCGDVTGALDTCTRVRNLFTEQLGIEPGQELARLHRAVLLRDPGLLGRHAQAGPAPRTPSSNGTPDPVPVPHELPADVTGFIGRAREIAAIDGVVGTAHGPAVVVVHGPPGGGKTAMVVRAAHRLADRFGDGQLYVDLAGAGTPVAVLRRVLRALGVAEAPRGLAEAVARYRSATAHRRIMVVLDNASCESEVRPLLPGSAGCVVLVAARRALTGLDGATQIAVPPFGAEDAVALLRRTCGPARVDAEPAEAAALAGLCDHLPLTVRIAGARLAALPDCPVSTLTGDLADEDRRLDGLTFGDLSVRSSVRAAYDALFVPTTGVLDGRLFRLLGLFRLPSISPAVAAALLDVTPAAAVASLARLAQAHLLEPHGHGRYRMRALVWLCAAEHTAAESSSARDAAARRVLAVLLGTDGRIVDLVADTAEMARVVPRLSVLADEEPSHR